MKHVVLWLIVVVSFASLGLCILTPVYAIRGPVMMPYDVEVALKAADRYLSNQAAANSKVEVNVSELANMAKILKYSRADANGMYSSWCRWAFLFSAVHFMVLVLAIVELRGRMKREREGSSA